MQHQHHARRVVGLRSPDPLSGYRRGNALEGIRIDLADDVDLALLERRDLRRRIRQDAQDQAVEVKTTTKHSPSPDMAFKIDESRLNAHYRERETRTYAIKNRATVERTVIVEHPIRSGWTLVEK